MIIEYVTLTISILTACLTVILSIRVSQVIEDIDEIIDVVSDMKMSLYKDSKFSLENRLEILQKTRFSNIGSSKNV